MDSRYETKSHTLLKHRTGDYFKEEMKNRNFEALDEGPVKESKFIRNGLLQSSNVLDRLEQMYENWEEFFTWSGEILTKEWEKIEEYQTRMGLR